MFEAIKGGGEVKTRGIRKIYLGGEIEKEREGNTKGVTMGTREFPMLTSVIVIVI